MRFLVSEHPHQKQGKNVQLVENEMREILQKARQNSLSNNMNYHSILKTLQ